MSHSWGAAALCLLIACASTANTKTTYEIDIGGQMDELFIESGWFCPEGPYPQFGGAWSSTGRWAAQGAVINIPVYPDAVSTIEIRGGIGKGDGQVLRCIVDGVVVGELPPSDDLQYAFQVKPEVVKGKNWAKLKLETALPAPKSAGDTRDLRVAVDWIRISADASARNILGELLERRIGKLDLIARDKVPEKWRFRYDPNDTGDSYGIQKFSLITYDDSAFDVVHIGFVPKMRRGDAAWYRTRLLITDKPDGIRKNLRLPGESFEKDGSRNVWVNGRRIEPDASGDLVKPAADALAQGVNVLAVKVMKGPFPKVEGDRIVERPEYKGEWSSDKTILKIGSLSLTPGSDAERISVRLVSPTGKIVGTARGDVSPLENGRRGLLLNTSWALNEYGEHSLVIEDGKGHEQRFPVHFLGVHFFHWGWYSAGGGTGWNGFKPCSNDYIDQLFSRLGDWGGPHHSITWGGCILEPGTGFHRTEKVDYIKKHREAITSGSLDFVGAPFPPRNICTEFGETLIRSMRKSLSLYQSQLGTKPHHFTSHDASLTPLLPQIMRICGYDTYVLPENWWGQGRSIPGSRDCVWKNPEGTEIRCLDSWYHGQSAVVQARRAVQQGKPAVLCNEEFACLDATVFLNQSDLDTLASEGIFLAPVDLAEYQRITDRFAQECVYQGDDALCYKGWTGGGESEVENERVNRLLETRLVALENLAAFAGWLKINVDQKMIDDIWNRSMRIHECHHHWGDGVPEWTQALTKDLQSVDQEMERLAAAIASKATAQADGVAVFNPLGLNRDGLVSLEVPEGVDSLASGRSIYPIQQDPDKPGSYLASLSDLPSCGYRHYSFSASDRTADQVNAAVAGGEAVLENDLIQVRIASDGRIISIADKESGRKTLADGNALYFARRHDKVPDEALSIEDKPLNLNYYIQAQPDGVLRTVCQGPVLAAVECPLRMPDYPALRMTARFSLIRGERQVRVRLVMNFTESTAVFPKGGPHPHEGTYFPGIFVKFPMNAKARPMADMAYCVTDNVLASTNHETFMKEPFRNGTFNALRMAGPNTGEYAVLTRGLPDFFTIKYPEPYLALSFGMGYDSRPYNGNYVREYALFVLRLEDRKQSKVQAYKAAQSYLVEPLAVGHKAGKGSLGSEASFASASGNTTILPGIQLQNGELLIRVLNLDARPVKTAIRCLMPLADAHVAPQGSMQDGILEMGPQAVREISSK